MAVRRIYLDHNATTPLHPAVREAMVTTFDSVWGNPSSIHAEGRLARGRIEQARQAAAVLIGGQAEEIIFTSGGTEGDNLAIRGLALAARQARAPSLSGRAAHLISSSVEHPAVSGALDELEREGFAVTRLSPQPDGSLATADLEAAVRPETVLVTLAAANHELGNVYPVARFVAVTRRQGVLFHTDAVQMVGRLPVDVKAWDVDALTLSGHKIHGPKGVGAIYLRRGVDLHPLVAGGHQERERRAGTENLWGILGLGEACRTAREELAKPDGREGMAALRDRLERRLLAIPGSTRNGPSGERVPGTLNVGFAGASGELIVIGLDLEGVSVSTGAACTSGSLAPSPVLLALGLTPQQAREAVRFSLGAENTADEMDHVASLVETIVPRVRQARASG